MGYVCTPKSDLDSPDDAIFIVALMEWDDGNPHAVRGLVSASAAVALGSSLGQPRDVIATALIQNISDNVLLPTGVPNFDDTIGIHELRFTEAELAEANARQEVRKTLTFTGDGGRYQLTFLARMERFFRSPDYRWSRLQGYVVHPDDTRAAARGLLELNGFYDKFRGDYFTTANTGYAGVREIDPNYLWSRLEGYTFPQAKAPAGTVPLYSWWSRLRRDNLCTSKPQYTDPHVDVIAPGYRAFDLAPWEPVYIYSPDLPQPSGTLPLHRWWSPGRQDNATLSHPSWRP